MYNLKNFKYEQLEEIETNKHTFIKHVQFHLESIELVKCEQKKALHFPLVVIL